jgi:hypothetical protein
VNPGETFESGFTAFTQVTITATGPFRAWGMA